jgi:hypothetical protein
MGRRDNGRLSSARRTSMAWMRAAAVAALALLAAACSGTPRPLYVPLGTASYGFAERPLGDVTYEVVYRAPIYSTFAYGRASRDRIAQEQLALAHDMALLRAADLALGRGMPAFREVRRDNDVRADVEDDPFYDSAFNRPYYDGRFYQPAPYVSPQRRTVVDVSVRLEVRLEPRAEPGTYDAADVKRKLLAAYPTALPSANGAARSSGGPIGTFGP